MNTMIPLGDAFEFIRNGKSVRQSKDAGGVPITRIETISDGTVDMNRVGFAGISTEDNEKWLLESGDILLSHINSVEHIGKCALFKGGPNPLIHGMNLLNMRPKQDILLPRYAMWALKDSGFKNRILKFVNKAVNQASISTTNLKTVEIPLPPLEEQRRIAEILDRADVLRRLRTLALDKLNTLGQAIFHEMFADTEYEQRALCDVGAVSTGLTPSTKVKEYFDGNVPFVTPGDLESSKPTVRYLSELGARKSRTVEAGSTLVCCIGTIGKMGMAEQQSAFNQQINAVQWGPDVLPEYGYFAVQCIRPQIQHIGRGASTTLPILKKSLFQKLEIPIAPLDAQIQFKDKLLAANKLIASDTRADASSGHLFASLQHRAFRGEL